MTRIKKTGGRPPIANRNEARTLTIGVRVSPNEMMELQERAKHMGMSPSELLRTTGLARRLPSAPIHIPAINREKYVELARLTESLNQITQIAKTPRKDGDANLQVDGALLEQLRAEVGRLRLGLIRRK